MCPSKIRTHGPVPPPSQRRKVVSSLPESAQRPSALRQTETTACVCPSNVRTQRPVATFHNRNNSGRYIPRQRPATIRAQANTAHFLRAPRSCARNGPSPPPTAVVSCRSRSTEPSDHPRSGTLRLRGECRPRACARAGPSPDPTAQAHPTRVVSALPNPFALAPRQGPATVCAQADGVHPAADSPQRAHAAARRHLPQPQRLVLAPRQRPATVRAQANCAHPLSVSLEGAHAAARGQLPEFERVVVAPRQRPPTIGAQADGCHMAGVPRKTAAVQPPRSPALCETSESSDPRARVCGSRPLPGTARASLRSASAETCRASLSASAAALRSSRTARSESVSCA